MSTAAERVRVTELAISRLLRTGVIMSLSLIAAGITITMIRQPDFRSSNSYRKGVLNGSTAFPHTAAALLHGLGHLEGNAVVTLGLLVLVSTPVARVAASLIIYALQKDSAYVMITTFVLMVLLLSFLLGQTGA